jgi:hypothetical protein
MSANIFNHAMNGSVRIGLVVLPAFKAGTYMLELASRVLNQFKPAFLSTNPNQPAQPAQPVQGAPAGKPQEGYAKKVYTFVHGCLPDGITKQSNAFERLSNVDLMKGAAFYTATTLLSIFVLNKLIGKTPEIYNDVAKFVGSPLRFDTNYDVVQIAVNYATKK